MMFKMSALSKLDIKNTIISITKVNEDDFICLTDMAKAKEGDNRAADIIKKLDAFTINY